MDVLIDTDTGMGTLGSDPDDGLAIALARRDNALVATDVDVDAFAALFAERVLAQLDRSSASSRTCPGPSNT